jgi:hypothetical protein
VIFTHPVRQVRAAATLRVRPRDPEVDRTADNAFAVLRGSVVQDPFADGKS